MPGVAPELSGTYAPACRASVRRAGLNSPVILAMQPVEGAVALPQTQLATAVADRAQLSRADAKRALTAFDELGNAEKVRIGGLVQLTVASGRRRRRKGRNPATGEEITLAAKPASVDLRARHTGAGEGSAAVGAEGASSARCLSKPAVPPLHMMVPGKWSRRPQRLRGAQRTQRTGHRLQRTDSLCCAVTDISTVGLRQHTRHRRSGLGGRDARGGRRFRFPGLAPSPTASATVIRPTIYRRVWVRVSMTAAR